jgi:membrane protein YqaA with SNARE-associated domain
MKVLKTMYDRLGAQVHSPYATPLLAFLFFIEAIFFVPVDPLLILYCIEHRARAWYFATIATVASVAGGTLGYFIGLWCWNLIGQKMVLLLFSPTLFDQAVQYFKQYEIYAVLIAGFTPFPYKLITLGAGFCKLPLMPFLICSFIARGARFYLLAFIISIWGEQIKEYIDRYFNLFVLLFLAILLIVAWFLL